MPGAEVNTSSGTFSALPDYEQLGETNPIEGSVGNCDYFEIVHPKNDFGDGKRHQYSENEIMTTMESAEEIVDPMSIPDTGAVVSGISGRFPSADNIDELKQLLTDNCDMCQDHDDKRWPFRMWGLPPRAGRIKDLTQFDGKFFGYGKEKTRVVEPQLRMILAVIYESIVDSGVNPASLRGTKTGLFMGLHTNEFETEMRDEPNYVSTGYSIQLATTVAQHYDFRGPVAAYDLACASGFGAFHNAVTAFQQGEIDQAVVCAVNFALHPKDTIIFVELQMVSPTGYSKFGDAKADGYCKSEACVSVFLQRKHIALRVYGSILGTRMNVDGFKNEGITFPSVRGQETLIRETKQLVAGLHSNHVEIVETHGTGTPAGDPIECEAISNVYCPKNASNERTIGPLLLGSIKTNMGHSEGASGLCALAKVVLMLDNEIIYKSLHFEKPNPNIESLVDGRAQIATENRRLNSKIIPLSCYGFGGANVHAILRSNDRSIVEPIKNDDTIDFDATNERHRLVLMFGRNEQCLDKFFDSMMSEKIKEKALTRDFFALIDSLCKGKIDRLMGHRGFVMVDLKLQTEIYRSIRECPLIQRNNSYNHNKLDFGQPEHHFQDSEPTACYFLYPGLGSQWQGMGSSMRGFSQFWSTIERLHEILKPLDFNLIRSLETANGDSFSIIDAFVGISAIQIALTNILKLHLNVLPSSGIIGHSVGEIACAYADGIFDERETILSAHCLASTLKKNAHLIEGSMFAVSLGFDEVQKIIDIFNEKKKQQRNLSSTIYISCDNGPESVTISGTKQHVIEFVQYLDKVHGSIRCVDLNIDFALHNPHIMQDGIKNKLIVNLRKLLHPGTDYSRNEHHWFSSVCQGDDSKILKMANAEYYATNLCKRVNFRQTVERIDRVNPVVIEIGPQAIFESTLRTIILGDQRLSYVRLMKKNEQNPSMNFFIAIGTLFQMGINLTLSSLYPKIELPVRKQVPSISSLLKWDHSVPFFVPKYPEQFSDKSGRLEIPIDLLEESQKFLSGHSIEGRVLNPATGYLCYVWIAFSSLKKGFSDFCYNQFKNDEYEPIEFHDVKLHRAVILGENESVRLEILIEPARDYFVVTEGGQIVVDGFVRSPEVNPNGLLYEDVAHRLSNENNEQSLSHDDVYKQFRVNGYDYGETFRCIQSASSNGRHVKVKFNGQLITLTDNILQSIFLSICSQASQGALVLPTGFDYIRFNPHLLLTKIRNSGVHIEDIYNPDIGKFHETTKDIMTEGSRGANIEEADSEDNQTDQKEPSGECIFDTYCDPTLGIIITDGIEMRGIKAIPVKRRELTEPTLESYKFVSDIEEPVEDLELSRNLSREQYERICTNIVLGLADTNGLLKSITPNGVKYAKSEEIELYLSDHLAVRHSELKKTTLVEDTTGNSQQQLQLDNSSEVAKIEVKELVKNSPFSLLSLLDSMLSQSSKKISKNVNLKEKSSLEKIKKKSLISSAIQSTSEHEQFLNEDMMLSTFTTERFTRPLLETIIDNCCQSTSNLRLLEINGGNKIYYGHLEKLISSISSQTKLDYTVAHPIPAVLKDLDDNVKLHTLKDIGHESESSLLSLINTDRPIDAVCLYDNSCHAATFNEVDSYALAPTLNNLTRVIKKGGFLLVMLRYKLSLAERFILALNDMAKINLDDLTSVSSQEIDEHIINRMQQLQSLCEARNRLLELEARRYKYELIGKKMDTTGCALYLYKNSCEAYSIAEKNDKNHKKQAGWCDGKAEAGSYKIIHVQHNNYNIWLNQLKDEFKQEADNEKKKEPETIWLCAVATKDNPFNGIVGLVQCLKREIGSLANLRCFFDCRTFKTKLEKDVTVKEIRKSANFQVALKKDLFWNCINPDGQWGSFRHILLDEYFDTDNKCPIDESQLIETDGAYANLSTLGDLSSFKWYQAPVAYSVDGKEQKLVKVNYSALNFRDIMMATGRLPLDSMPLKLAMEDCMLGLEFSGIDVTSKKRVCGMVFNKSLATQVICHEDMSVMVEIPNIDPPMSLKDAATLPVTYLTAIMALICRGKMQKGESILIHAGSGGVGQAAIRLALHHGLKVFTTVGSKEKRQFLLREYSYGLSEAQIFNSRDCSFEQKIMEATSGQGVDLVLNSLSDDKLQASIRCLAKNGRFLEIGKYDQAMNAKLELTQLDINKTFHSVHLDKLFDVDSRTPYFMNQVYCALAILEDGIKRGYIKPIPQTCFPVEKIEEAFRFMATGKHMGKVLMEIAPENQQPEVFSANLCSMPKRAVPRAIPKFQLDPSRTYIITGGLGGFGLELIKWLASVGGRYFVVTSRSGVRTGYQKVVLSRLERNHQCKLLVVDQSMANGTTRDGIEKLFILAKNHAPNSKIGGLFHLAVVLKDNLLENMTSEDFDLVCKPKADACVFLDEISRKVAPEMSLFVAFSSVSCGKGNAGQANYGYANSIMERVCEQRRKDNLHGLAIQWGAIGDVGIAFETLGGNDIIIGGTMPQRMPSCFSTLAKLLCSPFSICSSLVMLDRKSHGSVSKGDLIAAVFHVLGVKDANKVDDATTLGELGLDSLMAVEVRQYLEREYEMTLAAQEIRSLTIAKIKEIGKNGKGDSGKTVGQSEKTKLIDKDVLDKMQSLKKSNFSLSSLIEMPFRPLIELPKLDCFRLNNESFASNARPVFVLTHMHGSFDQLEMICKKISRPCVGLNYTKKLNKMQTFTEIAEYYFEFLESLDWTTLKNDRKMRDLNNVRVIDLVGYSFGALISYELLVIIQNRQREGRTNLVVGRYILLDMSPLLCETLGNVAGSLFDSKEDFVLLEYVAHHAKESCDQDEVVSKLASIKTGLLDKFKETCKILCHYLKITDKSKQNDIFDAIEACYRRYQVFLHYKQHNSYVGDATLIRAEKDLVNMDGIEIFGDYSLSKVIDGRVDLYKFPGNHESFIVNNADAISNIINNIM